MTALQMAPATDPFRVDTDGSIRLGDSRVLLDVVVNAFLQGETPEGIIERFPSAELADVYGSIAYYLKNSAEVGRYMAGREQQAVEIRQQIENRQGPQTALRDRLIARKKAASG